ncbi:archaeosortase A, PGF-CTERM-specific [Halopelagius inordinatus]|uniref:Archaeosortase A, PGF-CTERM-specific n=1 Tax=Halopelagius inordinatus TaxID=553467 RepID=A0A1I2N1J6_9EURY|nr:archaeosortase A [Halopelagius inordinatus]SFF97523.1 archaeosortase A, PGF-CTERM-specific [Halopelagius inordinatus]
MPGVLSDALAWVVIATFVAGAVLERRGDRRARHVTVAAWVGFALFWLQLIPHFAFVHKSYIEGFLSLAAVPACLYAGYLLYSGRTTLFVLSRAVAVMGAVYLPFETIPAFALFGFDVPAPRGVLMETVAAQTGFLVNALGYHPEVIVGEEGFLNTFLFYDGDHRLKVSVVLACTGLGSMTIFAGLIAAVKAPLRRKIRALAIALPIIYALNLLRTTFITIAFGKQYFQFFVDEILLLFGSSDPYMVSFFISDRIISQLLAVVALVGVTYLVVRELPELLTVVEDVLFMLTGDEYDLREALDVEGQGLNRGGSV